MKKKKLYKFKTNWKHSIPWKLILEKCLSIHLKGYILYFDSHGKQWYVHGYMGNFRYIRSTFSSTIGVESVQTPIQIFDFRVPI